MECTGCGTRVRPPYTPDAGGLPGSYPGGRCWGCYKNGTKAGHKKRGVVPCPDCGKPTRSKKQPASAYPGTVRAAPGGRCQPCDLAYKEGRARAEREEIPAGPPAADTVAGLSRYVTDRRKREAEMKAATQHRARMEAARQRFIESRRTAA